MSTRVRDSREIDIVILGDGGVGKSAICIRYIHNRFSPEYDPTIEDSYLSERFINERSELLRILDTAGNDQFEAVRDQYYRIGQGFIMVYSIVDRATFDGVKHIISKLKLAREGENVPIMLVGNKCDLDDQRKVTTEEGRTYARENGFGFLETSALANINVENAFTELVTRIRTKRAPTSGEKTSCCTIL